MPGSRALSPKCSPASSSHLTKGLFPPLPASIASQITLFMAASRDRSPAAPSREDHLVHLPSLHPSGGRPRAHSSLSLLLSYSFPT